MISRPLISWSSQDEEPIIGTVERCCSSPGFKGGLTANKRYHARVEDGSVKKKQVKRIMDLEMPA